MLRFEFFEFLFDLLVDVCLIRFEMRGECHDFHFDRTELKSEFSKERFFKKSAHVSFRFYDVFVHDFDVEFESHAVFVADETDFLTFHALNLFASVLDKFCDDVGRHFDAAALLLTKSDFFHDVAVDKDKHKRYDRKHDVQRRKRKHESPDEFAFKLLGFDSAKSRDQQNHYENDGHDDGTRCKDFFKILFHKITFLATIVDSVAVYII